MDLTESALKTMQDRGIAISSSPNPFTDLTVDLSVIIPTYNAKALAHRSVEGLAFYLESCDIRFEIVVVDDGSRPNQRPDLVRLPAHTRVIQLESNRGKGFAVRTGLGAVVGRCCVFSDVDLPYGMDSLLTCYRTITERDLDFVYGDRSLPGSASDVRPSLRRRLSSGAFHLAVSSIVGLQQADTQCGLKGFNGKVAAELARSLRTDQFAFDVEIFRFALDNGLRVGSIPVQLVNERVSSVRLLRDSLTMIRDLIRIRQRARRGDYRRMVRRAASWFDSCQSTRRDRC
jgi:dolichyl-phosphate beta-glucosyltransferase